MDFGMIGAALMLAAWAVVTLFFGAPGWSNALLTLGLFLLIVRIVMRGTPNAPSAPGQRDPTPDSTRRPGR